MKTKQLILTIALLALSSALVMAPPLPLGTAFTYQGQLNDGGNPANGSYDLWFWLHSAPSGPGVVAGPLTNSATDVTNGLFTVTLDFGATAFDGSARWLLIGVRTNGSETFTLLNPRQPLTPAPYALYAPSAGMAATAGSAGSVAAANVTGTLGTNQIPNLDAAKVASGTLADARLSANVALRSGGNTFSSEQSFQGNIRLNYNKLFLSDGSDPNHALGFYGFSQPFGGWVVDGPVLSGFSGGALGNKQGTDEEIVLCWSGPYVGIGTTNPTNRLQVAGTVRATAFIGDGSGLTSLNAANVTGTLGTAQIPDLDAAKVASGTLADARLSANVARRSGGNVFTGDQVISSGSLGIGTATPARPLHIFSGPSGNLVDVNARVVMESDTLQFLQMISPDGTTSGILFGNSYSTFDGLMEYGGDRKLKFRVKAEEVMTLADGNVGIGTSNPAEKLEVAGVAKATAFIGDGSGLTTLNAASVTGTLADARLSANVALLNNSQTFSGTKTFSANVTATRSLRLQGLLRSGSETNAASASYPLNSDGSTGLVIRRITSTTTSSNSVVARTDKLTLIRDGTVSGLNIVFGGGGLATINATGIDRTGNVVTRVLSTFSPAASTVVFSDAQKVVHYDISFGDIYDTGHTCHVVLDRYDDGVESDHFMVGTLTSTYNQ